jgi:hypothetical protein
MTGRQEIRSLPLGGGDTLLNCLELNFQAERAEAAEAS